MAHCCVPQCSNNYRTKGSTVSFHTFPKDEQTRKQWIINIRRDPGPSFTIKSRTVVCSDHFLPADFGPFQQYLKIKRLQPGAVPTVFACSCSKQSRKPPAKRQLNAVSTCKKMRKEDQPVPNEDTASATSPDLSYSSDDSLSSLTSATSPDKSVFKANNMKLLELRTKEKFCLARFASCDSDIRYYTGFPTYQHLTCFFQFLTPECNFLYYVGTDNTSEGVPYQFLNKRGPTRSLPPMEEFFMTLVRLRKGTDEKMLGDLFGVSEGHVSKILNTWILFLADRLKYLPIWPSQDQVQETMPPDFKKYYQTTRVIVDCTEMYTEHPSASSCQRETFSSYKHRNTAKGLLGIAPSGQITFISSLYAGRCSDKKIIRHCGVLDLLQEGDSLMADRGFDIEDDLKQRGCTLSMPPFLNGQDQFTEDQLKKSRTLAAVRVHIERAVRKVKEFAILSNVIPISICPMLEHIWFVCCHLANFTGSLIKQ